MKIGVVKEIKDKENRVALTPMGAEQLIKAGHTILLEDNAGVGSGFSNEQYQSLGVEIVSTIEAWAAELVIKIKEPLEQEYPYLKDNIVFTYLHLAGVTPTLTEALLTAGTMGIAYETVEDEQGRLPLLQPMSAVAGNMAASVGSYYLAKFNGGKGVQMGSVMGERHAKVMVIGNGTVGQHAAITADGMGANVFVFGRDKEKFERLEHVKSSDMQFVESTSENIAKHIKDTDLVVGGVLLAGAKAPHIVSEEMIKSMQPGSVIVDVSIDQGGCIETSHATSHSDPVYTLHDVIHYCVTNMPGAYPRTSTIALTNRTLPYVLKLANQGVAALKEDTGFAQGINTYKGWITYKPVFDALGQEDKYKVFSELD
jgi:alanine dehydrogenase